MDLPLNAARAISKMDREHLKAFEVEPPEVFKTGKQRRLKPKKCYIEAFQYLSACEIPEQAALIHGLYKPGTLNIYVGHAWVEIDYDIIFDGVLQRFYNKADYLKYYEAIEEAKYTKSEMYRIGLEHGGHYGPWH